MDAHNVKQSHFGFNEKKLSIYLFGFVCCCILTLIAFWAVMSAQFSHAKIFAIIFTAAVIQFLVQLIFFLRLNTRSEQGKTNVMSLVFAGVILITIVLGSLWIMWSLNYNMMH